jgi:MFS family permease
VPSCRDAGYRPVRALALTHLPRRPLGVLLGATLLSVAGDGITQVGVPWFVLLTTGSAGKAGVVALCTMLPAMVSSLASGALVDRAGARPVSVVSDVACGAAVAVIPVLQLAGGLRFWELCALMAATGLLSAPGNTARAVILPAVAAHSGVPLSRATGIYAGAARAASIIGAAAGGVLIAALGPAHALFIDAGTFAASAVLVAAGIRRSDLRPTGQAARARPARPGGYRRDLRDGIRLVAATPLLLGITLLTLFAQGLDQGWSTVILPVDVRDKLHSVLVLGTAETAFAAGALIGAVLYSALAERLPRWPVFTLGFIIVGMPRFAVAALTASPAPLIAIMAIEGLACGPLNPITTSITYQLTPEHMRGRAIGTMTATALTLTPFGALAAGGLIESLGLPAATAVFGGVYLLVTLVPAVFPLYRQMSDRARQPAHGTLSRLAAPGARHPLP